MPEHDHDHDLTLPADCPRRTVLRGALALGAAGVLAGCGGGKSSSSVAAAPPASSGDTGANTSPTTPADTGAAPSETPTTAASSNSGSSSAAGSGLGPASDVPVGGGKILTDKKIVLTQPKSGEFRGFSAVCTHAGCTVGSVSDGTINCPCHGSRFSVTNGAVVNGPATSPLPPVNVKVQGTSIVQA
ncbi:MAG: Rieske (2Fe-2S) protein [Streptosporangiaceae bacterium]